MIKKFVLALSSAAVLVVFGCASSPEPKSATENILAYRQKKPESGAVEFREVWGWVCQGREESYSTEMPLTDIGYFSASVGTYGELVEIPLKKNLGQTQARTHLVVTCEGRALTHFVIDPKYKVVDALVAEIMKAGEDYDGIQIDFENIPGRDIANFYSFLKKVSAATKSAGKIFTVCVPARFRRISDDAFPYEEIAAISDRVMIMAYDEHWSTSVPGPIASYSWCEKVCDYAVSVIPKEKLVMGLPFYGRSWEDENFAKARSFFYTNEFLNTHRAGHVEYVDTIPMVEFTATQKITYWFEDYYSTVKKMSLYSSKGVEKIAFWRVGLEDAETWNWIKISE